MPALQSYLQCKPQQSWGACCALSTSESLSLPPDDITVTDNTVCWIVVAYRMMMPAHAIRPATLQIPGSNIVMAIDELAHRRCLSISLTIPDTTIKEAAKFPRGVIMKCAVISSHPGVMGNTRQIGNRRRQIPTGSCMSNTSHSNDALKQPRPE